MSLNLKVSEAPTGLNLAWWSQVALLQVVKPKIVCLNEVESENIQCG